MEVFTPFRVVGSISGDVPASFTILYEQPVFMVPTGRTFQLYRGENLTTLRGGPSFENVIRAVSHAGKYRYVAEGSRIHAFSHHKRLWTQDFDEIAFCAPTLLESVDDLLFSAGENRTITVWRARTGERLSSFLIHNNETPSVLRFAHGYTNKLLVGTLEGNLHLYNFVQGKFLFSSGGAAVATPGTRGPTRARSVTALACSKYRGIVALGTADGRVIVYNYDDAEEVVVFNHKDASVTSVCFRTDADGVIASGTSAGEIAFWDVAAKTLRGVLSRTKEVGSPDDAVETPHTEAVHTLISYPGAPVITSVGADNAIVQFAFNTVDGMGLLLRERRGHVGSCSSCTFYNNDLLLTAGDDSALRCTHVFSDRASWEMSQGKIGRKLRDKATSRQSMKLPPAVQLATSPSRNYQWASVVSLHSCSAQLAGWRMDTRTLDFKLSAIATSMHTASCVVLSQCGNYAIVGYTSGNLALIKLQNRSIRHYFFDAHTQRAHDGAVLGCHVVKGNTVVVSYGADGRMLLWDLLSQQLLRAIDLPVPPAAASCIHQESGIIFIACADYAIRGFCCDPDMADGTPVRVFKGHHGSIAAMALTPDSLQHVVSSSTDNAILVWDVAAGVCVGAYRVPTAATSLAFHPDGLFLVTTHRGEQGAFLWTNNLRYGYIPEVITNPLAIETLQLPALNYPVACRETAEHSTAPTGAVGGGVAGEAESAATAAAAAAAAAAERAEKLDRDVSDDDEAGTGAGGGNAGAEDEAGELYDPKMDVAAMRRRADEERQKRLDNIPCEGITLSSLPPSLWRILPSLDQIRERNQPVVPPKRKDVPFFLQTTAELRPTFVVQLEQSSRSSTAAGGGAASSFAPVRDSGLSWTEVLLNRSDQRTDEQRFEESMAIILASKSAAQIDLELRNLTTVDEDILNNTARFLPRRRENVATLALNERVTAQRAQIEAGKASAYTDEEVDEILHALTQLFKFFAYHLRKMQNVDIVQGMIAAALKIYGFSLIRFAALSSTDGKQNELQIALDDVEELQSKLKNQIDHLTGLPSALVSAFTNSFV